MDIFLGLVLAAVSFILIGIVLLQDSKAGGLTSALSGMGGETVFGASGQKGVTKFTSILAVVFFVLCIAVGIATKWELNSSITSEGNEAVGSLTPGPATTGSSLPVSITPTTTPTPGTQAPLVPVTPGTGAGTEPPKASYVTPPNPAPATGTETPAGGAGTPATPPVQGGGG
ncbi:MAG: preprotein translocase subunit SecG [Planctomycetota bacterium]